MILSDLFEGPLLVNKSNATDYKRIVKTRPRALPFTVHDKIGKIKPDNLKKIMSIIESKCSEALYNSVKTDQYIYKGLSKLDEDSSYFYIDTTASKRVSKNTNNVFTSLTSILPSWKNWPKRDECLVCSSNTGYASSYGRLMVVLPFNGTNVANASDVDIWDSFPKLTETFGDAGRDIDSLNKMIQYLANYARKLKDFTDPIDVTTDNVQDIIKLARDASVLLKTNHNERREFLTGIESYISDRLETAINVFPERLTMSVLNDVFDPAKNGNVLTDTSDWNIRTYREIWFSGRAIMIDNGIFFHTVRPYFLDKIK